MKYLVNNVIVSINDDEIALRKIIVRKLRIKDADLDNVRIVRQSVDARKKNNIGFVYSVVVECSRRVISGLADVKEFVEKPKLQIEYGKEKISGRPIVVGMGPAGLFAALKLAQNGYEPIVLERGECVQRRTEIVNNYWKGGALDESTNVQFGEGGAGTFSDGKLTTRINDPECEEVLRVLVENGAPKDVLVKAKPHIGSDNLPKVLVNLRNKIIECGGKILFNTALTDIKIKDGRLVSIQTNRGESFETNVLVLAIGHSSRDTFEMLLGRGVRIIPKAFSVGFRIEHPQLLINKAQYGGNYLNPKLPNAEYQLFEKIGTRTAYTFCMCPGGTVVAAASERGTIVTNGMSEYLRNGENANSAFVVSVSPTDFDLDGPLAGCSFARNLEKKAFEMAGANGAAPIQRLKDFINNSNSKRIGSVKPTYTGSTEFCDLNAVVPQYIANTMKEALGAFDRKLKGFLHDDAILCAVESRTSSPIRIERDAQFVSLGISGIFPCGEGAGYAGGIMSAAVDGINVTKALMTRYAPLNQHFHSNTKI